MPTSLRTNDIWRLRRAMADVGTGRFFHSLRRLLKARMRFETFLMMRFDPGNQPHVLDAWLAPDKIPHSALSDYVENTYPLDPFFQHGDVPKAGALYRLAEIAPDRFFSSEYYLRYYRHIGLCDEVGLLVPLPFGARAHLSINRLETTGPFKRREMQCLRHHAPLLIELLGQHCAATLPQTGMTPAHPLPSMADLIRSFAQNTHNTPLTRREAQIAALVLQGHSNASAGVTLGIARETCKVHRRNLYRKLAISSQHDLFGLLKHLL